MPASKKKRTRRSADDRIAALQAQIAKIQSRAQQAKIKKDPALRHMSAALRSIDRALKDSDDKATRQALSEARVTVTACLALSGATAGNGKGTLTPRTRREKPEPDQVLGYIAQHPGSRSEEIAAQLGTDAQSLRAVLHQLRGDGRIKTEGKARATRYAAV